MGAKCSTPAEGPEGPSDANGNSSFKPNKRGCTDLICLIFFIAFLLGLVAISVVGYVHGNPKRLVHGTDWMGRTCGYMQTEEVGNVPAYNFTGYPYLIYPRLSQDLVDMNIKSASDVSLSKLYGVCVEKCPMADSTSTATYVHAYTDYDANPDPVNEEDTSLGKELEDESAGSPWQLFVNTTEVLYRCLELQTVHIRQMARCIDACTDEEEKAYNDGDKPSLTCGNDLKANPMRECGDMSCPEMISELRPSCSNMETARTETQVSTAHSAPVLELLRSSWYKVARWMGDIEKAALPILLCGGLIAMLLGFGWLLLLRFLAGFFVWLTVIGVCTVQLVLTLFCAYQGDLITSDHLAEAMDKMGVSDTTSSTIISESTSIINSAGYVAAQDEIRYWAIAAYVMLAVEFVLVLLVVCMCRRIQLAVGIVRESSKAVNKMASITFFPLLPTVVTAIFVCLWLIAAAFIATSASLTLQDVKDTANKLVGTPAIKVEVSDQRVVNYMLGYHLFGLLWMTQFIQAVAYLIVSGTFCEYYWTRDKNNLQRFPLLRSVRRTITSHCGSAAFGSLIIAIVQMLRIIVEYIDHQMKSAQEGNKIVKVVMTCLKCVLWCFEKCLKFLNKRAYIMIAMKGHSFCPAMKDSFTLMLSNIGRVATVSVISQFLLILGKIGIAGTSMFFMFVLIKYPPKHLPSFFMDDLENISSPIFPMILTGLLGYATASFFLDVYETAIDTILMCFCEDSKVNAGSGNYFMSDDLVAYIDGPAKKQAFRSYKKNKQSKEMTNLSPPITKD